MDFLVSCWFIIESIIIPDGFLKWFFLSFYIHPIFLLCCQIFLWLNFLIKWFFFITFYPLQLVFLFCLYVYKNFRTSVIYAFSFTRFASAEAIEEVKKSIVVHNSNCYQIVIISGCSNSAPPKYAPKGPEEKLENYVVGEREHKDDAVDTNKIIPGVNHDAKEDISGNNDLSTDCLSTCTNRQESEDDQNAFFDTTSLAEDLEMNEHLESVVDTNWSNSALTKVEVTSNSKNGKLDSFYKNYAGRMRWFDVLNHDRTCGLMAVLNEQTGFSIPFSAGNKESRKRLLQSLEGDIELVYVAQSCLSWVALHYQYKKVESLASPSTSHKAIFYNSKVPGEFQNFQVLLERFMENEKCEGKRVWNYVKERSSIKSLLQVPRVTGIVDCQNEESTDVRDVLKAIEQCIDVFWVFVKTDNSKTWWKLRNFLSTCPLVEDPRDLHLLYELIKKLQKKELWLKDVQGKKKCWIKKIVSPLEESERKQLLFAMIDTRLVSRVLQMSIISSSQLKWCHVMLDNIEFKDGKVKRVETLPLFPPS